MIDPDKIRVWLVARQRTGEVGVDYTLHQHSVEGGIVIGRWDELTLGSSPSEAELEEIDAIVVVPSRPVAKSLIISRLTDEQLDAAIGMMTSRQRERWRSPDSPVVYSDDAEVIGLLTAIGADPNTVLA